MGIWNNFKKKLEDVITPGPAKTVNDPTYMNEAIRTGTHGVLGQATAAQKEGFIKSAEIKAPTFMDKLSDAGDSFNEQTSHAGRFLLQNIVTRPATEVLQSIRQQATGKESSYTPGTAWEKYLMGDDRIDSIQKVVKDTNQDTKDFKVFGHNIPDQIAPVVAGANAALHVANDVPVVGAVVKGGTKIGSVAVKQVPRLAEDAVNAIRVAAKQAPIKITKPTINAKVSDDLKNAGTKSTYIDTHIKTMPVKNAPLGPNTNGSYDLDRIKKYEEDIKAGKPIDPVVVRNYEGVNMIDDGKHRLKAAENQGVKDIPYVTEKDKAPTIMGQIAQKAQDFATSLPSPGLSIQPVTNAVKVTDKAAETATKSVSDFLPKTVDDIGDVTSQIALEERKANLKDSGMIVDALKKRGDPPEKYLEFLQQLNGTKTLDEIDAARAAKAAGNKADDVILPESNTNPVSTATPSGKGELHDKFDNAPDPVVATPEQAQAFIGDVTDTVRRGTAAVNEFLTKKGSSYEQFAREIQEANRNGTDPSAETQELYNRFIKPSLDRARVFGGKETGEQKWYLPQNRPISGDTPTENYAGTLVNAIDIGDAGFAARRTDAIPLDELDYSPESLNRYFTKNASLPYGDQLAAQNVLKAAQNVNASRVEKGLMPLPEPTPEQAVGIVKQTRELGTEISKQAEKGGIVTSGTEKLNLLDKIKQIGKLKGVPQYDVDKGVSWAGRQFSSSDEIYKATYTDADGIIRTIGDGSGFTRYNDSDAIAHTIAELSYKNGTLDEDVLRAQMGDRFAESGLPTEQIQYIIDSAADKVKAYDSSLLNKINNADAGKLDIKPETIAMDRAQILAKAERNVAREEMSNFLQGANFQSKQLRKNIEQDAAKMLIQDKATSSLATKLVDLVTGAVYKGALGYNPISATQNLTELRRAYSELGEVPFGKALAAASKDPQITARYGIKEVVSGGKAADGKIQVVRKRDLAKPMGAFNATEEYKDAVLLHGLEAKYKANGLEGTQLTKAVLTEFNKLGFKGGKGGSLGFNKSKTGRILGQFMQYQVKDWKLTGSKAIDALGVNGVDQATKTAAQKYLARKVPSDIATYLMLNAAYGATLQQVVNFQNPFAGRFVDSEAGNDEKIVSKVSGIGGPLPGMAGDLYLAIREAYRNADAEGKTVDLADVANSTIKKDAALFVPGGNQFFNKTGGFLQDVNRGYNESQDGRARFAAPDNPLDFVRGLIAGRYTTSQAREYYGTSGVAGDLPGLGGERKIPVSAKYQEQIDAAGGNHDQIVKVIDRSRQVNDEKTEFFSKNPALKSVYDSMNKTTLNPTTKKRESDVLTPEKWRLVNGDQSGKLFGFMKQKAEGNEKDFGTPIDPIYNIESSEERRDALNIRAQPTGDDVEKQEILRATTDWYPAFEQAEKDYYAQLEKLPDPSGDSDYGSSARKQAWTDLEYPTQTPLIKQYYQIKEKNADAGKQFYRDNADGLSTDFDAYKTNQLKWTNEKRKLEGYDPISETTWKNVTFGYEADEDKVAKELYFKNQSSGGGASTGLHNADFGSARGLNLPSVNIKRNTVKVAKKGASKKVKITYKKG